MKKVNLTSIKKFEVVECPKPDISNDDDVLIKIDSVGVCGSDIHYYKEGKIGDQVIAFPFTIGHECSGIVEAVGKGVTSLESGDMVAVEPALSCHKCEQCLSGREHTCTNQKFLGCPGQADGCLAEYIVMPEKNCFVVPNSFNGEIAALVEPLSIGSYASQFIFKYQTPLPNSELNSPVAILGVGPIGLSVMLSLHSKGIKNISVTDKLNYRLKMAADAGAFWAGNPDRIAIPAEINKFNPYGFDIVFECCGQQEALDQAVDILKPGGMLVIVGIPETDRISFDISKIRRKEISIHNVRRQNNSIKAAIELASWSNGLAGSMITHRYTLDEVTAAFETVANYKDGVGKAMIKF